MRKLLNTLYVMTEDAYLSLDGENIVIQRNDTELARFPLHGLESVISFSYRGASPALMGKCTSDGIDLCFMRPSGKFLARVCGETRGNVLLRKTQYRTAEDSAAAVEIGRSFLIGKLYNSRWVLERFTRDHAMSVDAERLKCASARIKDSLSALTDADCIDRIRGIEGDAAAEYFGVFNELILNKAFSFNGRTRRPPMDEVNAMLSFAYALLANNCTAALESVGLDPYIGFVHSLRPGRTSLALDLMEELRSVIADRFVLSCINNRTINAKMFDREENGAVLLNDEGRRSFLKQWQEKKQETLTHPFLKEKMPWGLVPFIQASLLARYLRGDLDAYPPFLWK